MELFVAIQHTYHGIEMALYQGSNQRAFIQDDKKCASKNFITLLNTLLIKENISFANLSFIATNQGPGPFTTLRVVIASINGLSFATNKPIIGIDGLHACLLEFKHPVMPTVVMLNAYGNDVYYAYGDSPSAKGYCAVPVLLADLNKNYPQQDLYFVGNGTSMYTKEIAEHFGAYAHIPAQNPEQCSLQQIAHMALAQWRAQQGISTQILPLYLKSQLIAPPKRPTDF